MMSFLDSGMLPSTFHFFRAFTHVRDASAETAERSLGSETRSSNCTRGVVREKRGDDIPLNHGTLRHLLPLQPNKSRREAEAHEEVENMVPQPFLEHQGTVHQSVDAYRRIRSRRGLPTVP